MLAALLALLAAQDEPVDFFAEVRPLLAVHCHRCHAGDQKKGDLRLDSRPAALAALVPGKPAASSLYQRLVHADPDERMPAKAPPLPAKEIDILRRWIAQGAPWPADAELKHWAFRPLRRPPGTSIDEFVDRELARRGIAPAREAERRTLIRRVTLDLTGLPPETVDVEETYEKLVDRLLASPAYGERWGRHWLDVARFAESSGYEANQVRSSAWRYRDYVVRSFNEDKPYDRFLREQIAGDELQPPSDDLRVATGFLAHGRLDNNQEDRLQQRNDHLVDITNAAASVLFGLPMGCAQCHDHKWDPITQADYYRFQGYFVRGQVNNLLLQDPVAWKAYEKAVPPELEASKQYRRTLLEAARARLVEEAKRKLPEEVRAACDVPPERRTPQQQELAARAEKDLKIRDEQILKGDDQKLFAELDRKIQALEKALPEKPHAWAFYSPATGVPDLKTLPIQGQYGMPYDPKALRAATPRLLRRGDPHLPDRELKPGWPAVFGPTPEGVDTRSALVDWLTRPENPTVARVWVNIVWARHFGRGLFTTPGDVGLRGARPSHPELLDWLAADFIDSGWSLKALHRKIVTSSAYRRSARPDPTASKADPDNTLLWRWSPRRLEAEAIRDSLLAASGELDRIPGGPSVKEPSLRRTLYLLQKRHALPEVQALFDAPLAGESCPARHVSTVSLQPLYLMNSPFVRERAKAFAARVGSAERAFDIALGRRPSPEELRAAERLPLVDLCHALFSTSEFAYVE